MKWKRLNKIGNILIQDNLDDGLGIRNTREYLAKTFREFARTVASYYDVTEDIPFAYREKQTSPILFLSFAKNSDAIFAEFPVRRNLNGEESHGWVDYWIVYGKTIILVETKHSWQSMKRDTIRQDSQNKWREVISQVNNIVPTADLVWKGQNLVRIGLQSIPLFIGSDSIHGRKLDIPSKNDVKNIFDEVYRSLLPKPNWGALWVLHNNLCKPTELKKDKRKRSECYPAVMLFAHAVS